MADIASTWEISSRISTPLMMPSGLKGAAWKIALTTSADAPLTKHSLASLYGSVAILTLPIGKTSAAAKAPDCPASSLSNIRMISSNLSRYSQAFNRSLAAPAAPFLQLTVAHLCPWIWLTDIQSISPSVTTIFLPEFHRCAPNSVAFLASPTHGKFLSLVRSFWATDSPLLSLYDAMCTGCPLRLDNM